MDSFVIEKHYNIMINSVLAHFHVVILSCCYLNFKAMSLFEIFN